jgi:hypothetical protein
MACDPPEPPFPELALAPPFPELALAPPAPPFPELALAPPEPPFPELEVDPPPLLLEDDDDELDPELLVDPEPLEEPEDEVVVSELELVDAVDGSDPHPGSAAKRTAKLALQNRSLTCRIDPSLTGRRVVDSAALRSWRQFFSLRQSVRQRCAFLACPSEGHHDRRIDASFQWAGSGTL